MEAGLSFALFGLIALALLFDFLNGLHDAANSIATIVSTRVLSPRLAVLWAAFFNLGRTPDRRLQRDAAKRTLLQTGIQIADDASPNAFTCPFRAQIATQAQTTRHRACLQRPSARIPAH
jgi:hypothetical protein